MLAAVYRGVPRKEVAETFSVSLPTIKRWLNQVEIEFSMLSRECLEGRRIAEMGKLGREVGAW